MVDRLQWQHCAPTARRLGIASVASARRQLAIALVERADLRRDVRDRSAVVEDVVGGGKPLRAVELRSHDGAYFFRGKSAPRNDATDLFVFRAIDHQDAIDDRAQPFVLEQQRYHDDAVSTAPASHLTLRFGADQRVEGGFE